MKDNTTKKKTERKIEAFDADIDSGVNMMLHTGISIAKMAKDYYSIVEEIGTHVLKEYEECDDSLVRFCAFKSLSIPIDETKSKLTRLGFEYQVRDTKNKIVLSIKYDSNHDNRLIVNAWRVLHPGDSGTDDNIQPLMEEKDITFDRKTLPSTIDEIVAIGKNLSKNEDTEDASSDAAFDV